MKREIKFRGKDFLGRWHYGHLHLATGSSSLMIQVDSFDSFGVIPETVGQFTGLLDKNGKEIYEGDIIEIKDIGGYGCKRKGVVEYDVDECTFVVRLLRPSWVGIVRLSTKAQICADMNSTYEYFNQFTVIGNIHDMEGGAE